MRLTGQSREAANAAVTLMVNHLVHLSDAESDLTWFIDDERLREAATAETVSYCTGMAVPSLDAQVAWEWRWNVQFRSPFVTGPLEIWLRYEAMRNRADAALRAAWLKWIDLWPPPLR